jgi:subtilisin family serine protease
MKVLSRQLGLSELRYDAGAAARQASDLRSLATDPGLAEQVAQGLLARRAELADEGGRSATRVGLERVPTSDGRTALAAAGELLVAGAGRERAARLLHGRGFRFVASTGPVTRLVCRGASIAEVLGACAALRELGVTVGPNYVTAVGPVGKGMSGLASPRPTTCCPGDRPIGDTRGAGVRVAVIDTGVDVRAAAGSHGWLHGIDIDGSASGNRDLLDAVPAPDGFLDEAAGHGTFVVGIVRQVAPACAVTAIKALDSDGIGTDFSVADALFRLAEADEAPDLVNLSLACLADEVIAPVAIDAAIEALTQRHPETLVVAAAGNDGSAMPTWPAAHKSVLSVGACDGVRPAAYSNTGYWVDFSVPADGIVSTYVQGVRRGLSGATAACDQIEYDGPYAAWSGTSFAAPQVTGLLAALRGEGRSASQAVAELKRRSVKANGVGRILPSMQAIAGQGDCRQSDTTIL